MPMKVAYSVGIIGGADGPTAVFVTGNPLPGLLAAAAIVLGLVLLIRHFKKK